MAVELNRSLRFAVEDSVSAHRDFARPGLAARHQRTDYPQRDNKRFLKHSLAYRTDGEPRIEYLDVVITRWPPGERVYGSK